MGAFPRRLRHILRESGPAPDSPGALRVVQAGGWRKTLLLRFLRVRFSPDVLERIRALPLPMEERGRLFSQAMSLLNVNETYKTTGFGRTRLVDAAILRLAGNMGPVRLLEVGASDGSASLELLERLANLRGAVLADLHPELFVRGPGWLRIFLDGRRRLLGVKALGLYLNLGCGRERGAGGFSRIETANPLLAGRPGVEGIRPFDALHDALAQPVEFIKCANVLNREYFGAADIRAAVANLGRSLADGGYLFVSQNNARYPGDEAYFVLQRQGAALALVEEQNGHEALALFADGAKIR